MPLADYAHWNEDAQYMWWHEEGKHIEEPPDVSDDDWGPGWDDVIECTTVDDCMRDGNYNWVTGTLWECSTCYRPFRKVTAGTWIPDETFRS